MNYVAYILVTATKYNSPRLKQVICKISGGGAEVDMCGSLVTAKKRDSGVCVRESFTGGGNSILSVQVLLRALASKADKLTSFSWQAY